MFLLIQSYGRHPRTVSFPEWEPLVTARGTPDILVMLPADRRVQVLEEELARVRAELQSALDAVPEALLTRAPEGQWSPAQIIWHVAKVERGVARLIERLVSEIGPMATVPPGPSTKQVLTLLDEFPFLDRSLKARAPEGLQAPAEVDLAAELGRWRDGRVQLLEAAHSAGPRLSLIRYDHPIFGSFNGWQWVLMIARHEQRHLLQLREVVASGLKPT